jgi:propionyl-CoA carboxylase alpha chain
MPSTGRLVRYIEPDCNEGSNTVRVDTGVYEGGEVSMFYDPMIAKLITYGEDRAQAIDRMVDALDHYYIRGVKHNISFLSALMVHPRFVEGRLSTNFIADEFADGFNADLVAQDDSDMGLVVAAAVHQLYEERASLLSNQLQGHEHVAAVDWVVVVGDRQAQVAVELVESGYLVSINDSNSPRDYIIETDWSLGAPMFKAEVSGTTITRKSICVQIEATVGGYRLFYRGTEINAQVLSPKAAQLSAHMLFKEPADMSSFLLSPMPGLLTKLVVKVGQEVKEGEELAVVEAMKMENSLRAVQDGIVAKIAATEGDSLMVDEIILEFA